MASLSTRPVTIMNRISSVCVATSSTALTKPIIRCAGRPSIPDTAVARTAGTHTRAAAAK